MAATNLPRTMSRNRGAKAAGAYAQVGLETQLMSASPEKIITLLFEGAKSAVSKAKIYMATGQIEKRSEAITKAYNIIVLGLRESVDSTQGVVAASFIESYNLMAVHLLEATKKQDVAHLDIVLRMLSEIGDAWAEATNTR